ncbi:unnamed protein product [Rotaria sp. Silwood1]|nr:unnamed protein product [Rotaria sp. Silwood1]
MISCSECDVSYIGKAIRQALKRHQEHGEPQQIKSSPTSQTDVHTLPDQHLRRSDRNKGKPKIDYFPQHGILEEKHQIKNDEQLNKSAIYKHHTVTNHKINWKGWEIISKDIRRYRLLVRKSLHILQKKPFLNRTTSSAPLLIYPEGL